MIRSLRLVFAAALGAAAFTSVTPTTLPRVDTSPLPPPRPVKYSAQAATQLFPYSETFALHSLPGAQRVIYLDFNGETVSGSAWNDQYTNGSSFYAAPFDTDGNPGSFSSAEMDSIQGAWARVAEDYAPFAVDVTTQDPTVSAIDRAGAGDSFFGTRALIMNTNTIYSGCTCSGVAFIGTFGITSNHEYYEPALIFNNALHGYDKDLGDTISHEVGHNLGLEHDGTTSSDYYMGQGAWAPIMGAGFYHPLTQFSKGEYANANMKQDDFAVMQQNGLPLRTDDFGNTTATAAPFPASGSQAGIISTDADVDVFSVAAGDGPMSFTVSPAVRGPNLDLRLELLDAAGNMISSNDPPSAQPSAYDDDAVTGLAAAVSTTATAGTYYVRVQGVGTGDPLMVGYSGYGSVGQYTLTGTVPGAVAPPSVSVYNRVLSEGNSGTTNMTFTVSQSAVSASDVTVNYATSDLTAIAGSDYAAASGTVTIPAGLTSATFTVLATGDITPEAHEKFLVTLSSPVGATLSQSAAVGWIVNDDGIGISIADVSNSEGTGSPTVYTFTLTLSNAPSSPVSVFAATAKGTALGGGVDYGYTTQTINFAKGQRIATFSVTVRGDAIPEGDEFFYVNLSNPTGTNVKIWDAQAVGTIRNDD